VPSLSHSARRALLTAAINLAPRWHYGRLIDASKQPAEAQSALLGNILSSNAETDFGKRHGFSRIKGVEDFRAAVPVQTYEDLRPHIERQELTGAKSLTAEQPVFYHRTSGTVGAPKDIPVTKSGLERIKRHQRISAYAQSRGSKVFDGRIFAVTGQAIEGRMPGGSPFGSASGLLYEAQSRFVRSRYVLPPALSAIEDYEARYLAMAAFGLLEPNVSGIATANPSTLTKLLSVINERSEQLIEAVATGRLPDGEFGGDRLGGSLRADAARAKELDAALGAKGQLTYRDIWPNLRGLVTWTGGSCGVSLAKLAESLPTRCQVIELGYLASELRGTVNVDIRSNVCLPMLLDSVFEFSERDAWEAGRADFLSLHELESRREYYLFVTTIDGLYRYDMNDVVRVTGMKNATPTLEFVQKGKGITSITGEKLSETQVLEAVNRALADRDIQPEFFVMLADQDSASYTLYVEARVPDVEQASDIANDLDCRLRAANIEYDGKRSSGRLAPLDLRWLRRGTGDSYRAERVAGGQRDAQFKYLHLQYAHECPFDFDGAAQRG